MLPTFQPGAPLSEGAEDSDFVIQGMTINNVEMFCFSMVMKIAEG